MRNLSITLIIAFFMFSSTSFTEWIYTGKTKAATYYVNFESIKKVEGYHYYWDLIDYLRPTPGGTFSSKTYRMLDCKLLRSKILSDINYKEPMGAGVGSPYNVPDENWTYPSPDSILLSISKIVCNYN